MHDRDERDAVGIKSARLAGSRLPALKKPTRRSDSNGAERSIQAVLCLCSDMCRSSYYAYMGSNDGKRNIMASIEKPRLFHAPSSYYSMIARLALAEVGIDYKPVLVDIHIRMTQQSPDYVRLNPNMSVPTLTLTGRNIGQSRLIAEFAFNRADIHLNVETKYWVDLHYSFPIEELTIGGFLAQNRMARLLIPRKLAKAHRHLLAMADTHPDLADAYRDRATVFAERMRTFNPEEASRLTEVRRNEAIDLLEQLDRHLARNNTVMVPPTYGIADAVWTVFLARMVFVGMVAEINKRPSLVRYWNAMQARPSFAAADIWTTMHVSRLIGGILGIGIMPGVHKTTI